MLSWSKQVLHSKYFGDEKPEACLSIASMFKTEYNISEAKRDNHLNYGLKCKSGSTGTVPLYASPPA